jgi:hypothetical protein
MNEKKFNLICADGYMMTVTALHIEDVMGIVNIIDSNGTAHEVMRVATVKDGD